MSEHSPGGIIPSPTNINPSQEIFDYVMHNPENTNPNILKSLLNTLADSAAEYYSGTNSNSNTANAFVVKINANRAIRPTYSADCSYSAIEAAYNASVPIYFLINTFYVNPYKDGTEYKGTFQNGGNNYLITFYPSNAITVEIAPNEGDI